MFSLKKKKHVAFCLIRLKFYFWTFQSEQIFFTANCDLKTYHGNVQW